MTDKNNLIKLGKFFIKELKLNNLYRDFLKKYAIYGYNYSNFNEMIIELSLIANGKKDIGGFYIKTVRNDYDIIINHINTLIHIFLEKGLHIPPTMISQIGEHFFQTFSIDIFGEEKFHKDMEILSEKNEGDKMNVFGEDVELKRAYLEFRRHGINIDFESFKLFHKNLQESLTRSFQEII